MCYAIPAEIVEIAEDMARVDYGGVVKDVNISLVDGAVVGDFVLIHAGFALEKLERQNAMDALEIIRRELENLKDE